MKTHPMQKLIRAELIKRRMIEAAPIDRTKKIKLICKD